MPGAFEQVGEAHFGYDGDASITVRIETRGVYRLTQRYREAASDKRRRYFGIKQVEPIIVAERPGVLAHTVAEDGRNKLVAMVGDEQQTAVIVCSFTERLATELRPQLRRGYRRSSAPADGYSR